LCCDVLKTNIEIILPASTGLHLVLGMVRFEFGI